MPPQQGRIDHALQRAAPVEAFPRHVGSLRRRAEAAWYIAWPKVNAEAMRRCQAANRRCRRHARRQRWLTGAPFEADACARRVKKKTKNGGSRAVYDTCLIVAISATVSPILPRERITSGQPAARVSRRLELPPESIDERISQAGDSRRHSAAVDRRRRLSRYGIINGRYRTARR